jgi:ABC-type sugar transport system ATPase subunit
VTSPGIDVGARAEIHRLIVSLARDEGLAVMVISSDMQEVLRLADRVLVMHEGRITGEFSRAEATQESVLTAALVNRGTDEDDSFSAPR